MRTLDREIALEERLVGIPTNHPLTDSSIAGRRLQIAVVLGSSGLVALFAVFAASGVIRVGAIGLAVIFAAYAIEKDHHLRRLALLRGDSMRITLVVANELMSSGALTGDRELLDLRDGIGRTAGRLAAGLADVVRADCTRVRLLGPSGEVPVAAERELSELLELPDDPGAAQEVLRKHKAVRRTTPDDRSVLVVAMRRGEDVVGLLEAIAPCGDRFRPGDLARAEAYARGAVAALAAN
ncbi:MAG TPA: hypothetical protein VL119_00825 [Acidimicrobiia bacterium]|nr:hypothetical protein [Acidimicrobiia bacterium]